MTQELSKDFIELLNKEIGAQESAELQAALDSVSPVSVRVNGTKKGELTLDVECEVEWSDGLGFYLTERPSFTFDPQFHGGAYYVQEASSMIVGRVASQFEPQRVLDLCAAPGGKSTHLAQIVGEKGVVVANEVMKNRAQVLKENVIKWGSGNVVVTSSDPIRFGVLTAMFDMLVIDAPCSGEGMFRKDMGAREEWSLENVEICTARSRRIVADAWNALQTGGILIYSTCTFNRSENEDTVAWICEELGAELIPQDWNALGAPKAIDNGFGAHFYPHRTKGEGLFCAVMRKTSDCDFSLSKVKSRPMVKVSKNDETVLNNWVKEPLNWRIVGKTIYGYNQKTIEIIEELLGSLNVLYSGVEAGELIRGELKPAHPLALYPNLNYPNHSHLSKEEALKFLRKDVATPEAFAEGLSLVTHQHTPLGWAKRIATRVNNNYPQGWRILKRE